MPYLHCTRCRLTLFKPRTLADSVERCPRCGARMSGSPRKLFATPLRTGNVQQAKRR